MDFPQRLERVPRHFGERQTLPELRDYDLRNYRLPRHLVQQLCEEYSRSEWANNTLRSHAIPAETEVRLITNVK